MITMHFNEGERHYLVWLRLRRAVFFVFFVLLSDFRAFFPFRAFAQKN
jgi:hypothetical protein